MITALLKRIEELYTAAEDLILGGGYARVLSNWVFVVIAACIAAFIIDQTIWMFMYKPYKRWMRTIRGFNRGADRVLDAALGLVERVRARISGVQPADGGEIRAAIGAGEPAPPIKADRKPARAHNSGMDADEEKGDTVPIKPSRKHPAPTAKPTDNPPPKLADWTAIPPSYEGVRWWEPADKEQI